MKKYGIPSEIFDLLASKDYKSLSKEEKNLVDNSLTQEEYDDMKNTVSDFLEIDEEIKIGPRPFSFSDKRKSSLSRLLNYPIPAYQVAASMLVLFGLFFAAKPVLDNQGTASTKNQEIDTMGISISEDVYPEALVFEL